MRTIDDRRSGWRRPALTLATAGVLMITGALTPPALGATEAQQGVQLLRSVESGKLACSSLTPADADRIGEYAMERMLGSTAAHDAMNRQVTQMMGGSRESQAHVFMGRRFAGCPTGRPTAAFGAMMGTMGAGMMGSAYGDGTPNMGGGTANMGSGARGANGSMGAGNRTMRAPSATTSTGSGDNGWSTADTVMVGLMGLLVAVALGALAFWRTERRDSRTPAPA